MPINYEAIGRCKVLGEQVEALKKERAGLSRRLSQRLSGLGDSLPGVVYSLDMEVAFADWKELERVNCSLMIAVNDFNRWAQQADQRPISVYAPHEQ